MKLAGASGGGTSHRTTCDSYPIAITERVLESGRHAAEMAGPPIVVVRCEGFLQGFAQSSIQWQVPSLRTTAVRLGLAEGSFKRATIGASLLTAGDASFAEWNVACDGIKGAAAWAIFAVQIALDNYLKLSMILMTIHSQSRAVF